MMVTTRDDATRQTLSVEQAARILGIGRTLAYQMARDGRLPALRLGDRLLIPRPALERLLAGESAPAAYQPPQQS